MRFHPLFTVLGSLTIFACSSGDGADCPPQSAADADGVCRKQCGTSSQCLINEVCTDSLCVPPDATTFEIRLFEIDDNLPSFGGTIVVDYAVLGATDIELFNLPMNGPETSVIRFDAPVGTFDFTNVQTSGILILRASKGGQTLEARQSYALPTVDPSPRILVFETDPPNPTRSVPFDIVWTTSDATGIQLRLDNVSLVDDGPPSGRKTVMLDADGRFTLTAFNGGASVQAELFVTPGEPTGPKILDFTSNAHLNIRPGDSFALSWVTEGADFIEVYEGTLPVYQSVSPHVVAGGSWIVSPRANTTYELRAFKGQQSTVSAAMPVVVRVPRLPRLTNVTITPDVTTDGNTPVTIRWQVNLPNLNVTVTNLSTGQVTTTPQDMHSTVVAEPTQFEVRAENVDGADAVIVSTLIEVFRNNTEVVDVADRHVHAALMSGGVAYEPQLYSVAFSGPGFIRVREVPPCTGNLVLTLHADGMLHNSAAGTAGCALLYAPVDSTGPHELTVGASAGSMIGSVLPYEIRVESEPHTICGDGVLQRPESCDDGNLANRDGCDSSCVLEPDDNYFVSTQMPDRPPVTGDSAIFEAITVGDPNDDGFHVVPLPFPFPMYGRRYSAVVIHTNGFVGFEPNFLTPNVISPMGSAQPNSIIAPFAADLRVPESEQEGAVWFGELTPPNGSVAFGVRWGGLTFAAGADGNLDASLVLRQDGTFDISYHALTFSADDVPNAGIEDFEGRKTTRVPSCEQGCSNAAALVGRTFVFGNAVGPL